MVGSYKTRARSSVTTEMPDAEMPDVVNTFLAIPPPPTTGAGGPRFAVQPIAGYDAYRIAKDTAANPALLITTPSKGSRSLVDYSLENLQIVHGVTCEVSHVDGSKEEGKFSLIRCISDDPTVHDHFLRGLESIIVAIGAHPTATTISLGIGKLVELFRLMHQQSRKSVQGLWAELLLIADATDSEALGRAWHATFMDMYDFNAGSQRVEVKSAAGRHRLHHFALAQVTPPYGTDVIVASVLVERASSGPSVFDLAKEVRARLSGTPELLGRVDQIVAEATGDGWRSAAQTRFDKHAARQSIAFYHVADVPRIETALPAHVSDVHFRADLDSVLEADRMDMAKTNGLFAAVLPVG